MDNGYLLELIFREINLRIKKLFSKKCVIDNESVEMSITKPTTIIKKNFCTSLHT